MPEDQGVNGDRWNNEASVLLTRLGWTKVGDSNIDVINEDGNKHGLDGMFVFADAKRNNTIKQGVLVEAKRYKTTSFKADSFYTWITTVDKKLTKLKNSNDFQNTFPHIGKTIIRNGLLVVWFSDLERYSSFKLEIEDILVKIKLSSKSNINTPNHIYLLHNEQILRLCSLIATMENINSKNKNILKFYYPSSDYFNTAAARSEILTLDYMFSKFILAESVIRKVENKFVFYFGDLSIHSFERLKSFLLTAGFADKGKPLTIYKYFRNDEFRKIEPDVKRIFTEVGVKLKIEDMELFADLPTFLK